LAAIFENDRHLENFENAELLCQILCLYHPFRSYQH
jgi:hypothetical protein